MNYNLKMDINFLDKPLYFLNLKSVGKAFVWEDIEGYIYRSGYNLPDYLDMLILLYLVLKSQREGNKTEIVLSRCEILRECGLSIGQRYYIRLEESLRRWQNVSIEFKGTFYDGKRYKTMLFGIIDDAKIREVDKRVVVKFNENWLIKVKESNFYKYLNFEFYKHLKKPISRRLYELMLPKCYDGKEWYVYATNFGLHLGMAKRKIKTKQGEKEVIYASDVLTAIKAGFKEINQLSTVPDICEKLKINPNDLFTLDYTVKGEKQKRVVYIKKLSGNSRDIEPSPAQPLEFEDTIFSEKIPNAITVHTLPEVTKQKTPTMIEPFELSEELKKQYDEGIAWIKQIVPGFNFQNISTIDKNELAAYFPKLKIKIDRDMKKSKKSIDNLAGYILECLRNKWELPKPVDCKKARLEKEEELRQQELAKQREEKENERKKSEKIEAESKRFMERVSQIELSVKQKLSEEAKKITPKSIGNLDIAINYIKLMIKHINEKFDDNFALERIDMMTIRAMKAQMP